MKHKLALLLLIFGVATITPVKESFAQNDGARRGAVSGAIVGGAVGGRRGAAIGAVAGAAAENYIRVELNLLNAVRDQFKNPKELLKSLQDLQSESASLRKRIESLDVKQVSHLKTELQKEIIPAGKYKFIGKLIEGVSPEAIRKISGELRQELPDLLLVLATVLEGKPAVAIGIGDQLLMVLTLMLTTKGIAAVPRASLVVLSGTLATFGLPLEGIAVILGVDELMDMARTATNVLGNCLATVVVAKWEGQFPSKEALAAGVETAGVSAEAG